MNISSYAVGMAFPLLIGGLHGGLATPVPAAADDPEGLIAPAPIAIVAVADPVEAPLSLVVEQPTGDRLRLVYVPGSGWATESASESRRPGILAAITTAHAADDPPAADPPDPGSAPLSVFIDGPTGSVFAWIEDAGWKFIGRVSAHAPRP